MPQSAARIPRNKRSRPKNSPAILMFDKLVIIMGMVNVVATLPQVFVIWVGQDATGVSTYSWGYYSLFSFVFLMYGILHRELPIIASYTGSVILFSAIFIGSIIY